ncbi:leucyl/phenylalanyl-tRNA--protein transferase [Arcicella rigui]|uniref:Leucyl/phenylalanyl-tRNA--protein transferase n=1 Tax=Arcicella rigui TaxID=797020 RepID=A0ABU5QBE3_9BACT|nr:leucyl/phenylalanyl-tRNA--protein transferase [Arcicella rigui]MEA5140048.1 leucyl/phenylalanyl-tRNA--protein transferase [Arcicella rigui]
MSISPKINTNKLTADDLIYGYMNGIFPMADTDGTLYWYSPDPRAIIPIDTYKPPKSLKPILNKKLFEIRINANFEAVMRNCAAPRKGDADTWISDEIVEAYCDLNKMGLAHSVEAYIDDSLVGGLYGVCIGAVFFGESMFYKVPESSKVAFHYLMEILKMQGFELLDTQFINDNVRRYGAIEIPRADYVKALKKALEKRCVFTEINLKELLNG